MRRSDREITDEQELLQVISECDVCRLALNDEEVPYILPLNFGEEVSGGRLYLYFHGAAEGSTSQGSKFCAIFFFMLE